MVRMAKAGAMSTSVAPIERRLLGVLLRCCSATAFAMMGALLKLASLNGAGLAELVFWRGVGGLLPIVIWVAAMGGIAAIRVRSAKAHLTRSIVGVVSMAPTFGALGLLPLAQATTLTYSAPITATILSALFLGEAVGPRRWMAVCVGFVGILLVTNPFGEPLPIPGLMVGLCASLGQATVIITIRQIAGRETVSSIVFWFTVATSLAGGCFMPFYGHWHDPLTMAFLFGAGVAGGCGQIAMTSSLRFAPVSVVVPFDYLQILWATVIGWLVMASPSSPSMLAGAALIVGSGLYTAYREHKHGKQTGQALAPPEA